MSQFDAKFLITDVKTGIKHYPDWCLPYVQEMKIKLEMLLQQCGKTQTQMEMEMEMIRINTWEGATHGYGLRSE
jgi:hypothetical protein